ncbi:DNA recombination protein RmuC [Candidatus Peregrinibacteria bacterium]|nr:MAG: DNA recombination protein RmuC [Candidatus Peregrinibacteria bacterium]
MSNTILALVLAILAVGGLIFFINKKFNELKTPADDSSQKLMLQLMADLRKEVGEGHGKNRQELEAKLNQMTLLLKQQQSDNTQTLQKQFAQSTAIIQEVTKNLTHLQETNKQVVGFAEQMKSLENILKNPKQRGILGEYFLETLLNNVLAPGQYSMQFKMANGEIVDAAIFYNQMVIPVDAKFSLEKYNLMMEELDAVRREELEKAFKTDVKKRIDETSKYIHANEGTTDFAFMFIPAEGVYYNLMVAQVGSLHVNTENLLEYAFKKRVIIVSPTSFFAYLQTVIQGMKAMKMEESVKEVLKNIETLGKHVGAYDEYMQKLGKQLGTTVNTYNTASREFKKIDKDVYKLSDGKVGGNIEALLLEERPLEEN